MPNRRSPARKSSARKSKFVCSKTPFKARFGTELDAKIALANTQGVAASARHRPEDRRGEQRYYRCPACKGWHLTSQNARSPKAA